MLREILRRSRCEACRVLEEANSDIAVDAQYCSHCPALVGKQIHLGHHDSEEGAAKAYDLAAIKYFGEFARLNLTTPTPNFPL